MTVASINSSKEYVIFNTFAESKTYKEALEKLEAHDNKSSEYKIFTSPEDKMNMRKCYQIFKNAEKTLPLTNDTVDYTNEHIIASLRKGIETQLPTVSQKVIKKQATSANIEKANIGFMLLTHLSNLRSYGSKTLSQMRKDEIKARETRYKRDVATTSKHGIVAYGSYSDSSVFTTKSPTYKTTRQIIQELIRKEK